MNKKSRVNGRRGRGAWGLNWRGLEALESRQMLDGSPYVTSIIRNNPAVSGDPSANDFLVSFSVPVAGVDVTDFALTTSQGVTGVIQGVTPVSGSLYLVAVRSLVGRGTVALKLANYAGIHSLDNVALDPTSQFAGFGAPTEFITGTTNDWIVTDDVNNDGIVDLIGSAFIGGVGVNIGRGDGTFFAEVNYSVAGPATRVEVADVDGDGKKDLIASSWSDTGLSVLRGNGNGTFRAAENYATGASVSSFALGDLNNDGRVDVVASNMSSPYLVYLLNNGSGGFGAANVLSSTDGDVAGIGDVNGDGKADVIAGEGSSKVGIYRGNGNGTFQGKTVTAGPFGSDTITVVDMNGDGKRDVVVSSFLSNSTSVLIGRGDGTFFNPLAYSGAAAYATVIDLTGDGRPDVVASNSLGEGVVTVLVNNGTGSLYFGGDYHLGSFIVNPAVADFDGDGKLDLIVANSSSDSAFILHGAGGVLTSIAYNVDSINDQPTFTASDPPAVDAGSGQVTIPNWATFLPGDEYESLQTAIYTVTVGGNASIFSVPPAVGPDGTLTYTPGRAGVGTFNVFVTDSGGTANGGVNVSTTSTFTVTINPAPHSPSVSGTTTLEDTMSSTGLVISRDAVDELLVTHYKITGISGGTLFQHDGVTPIENGQFITFAQANAGLRFLPGANLNSISATTTFDVTSANGATDAGLMGLPVGATIDVTPVNDQPSFTASSPAPVNEDTPLVTLSGWATLIRGGGSDESGQSGAYVVTGVSNPSLFAVQPSVSVSGVLTYTPAANASGTSTFTVTASDSGGTSTGGVNTSASQIFTITVNPLADTPTITSTSTLEDTQSTTGLVLLPNPVDSGSATHFKITFLNGGKLYLSDGTTEVPSGSFVTIEQGALGLRFTPSSNANSGFASFSFTARASIGASDAGVGGTGVSPTITVTAVNDRPTFSANTPPPVKEDSGSYTLSSWAGFSAGGASDEASQTVTYAVSNISIPGFFAVAPTITAQGVLSYTLAANSAGSVSFDVVCTDSGGTANGGIASSFPQTFTLNVLSINDTPSFSASNPPESFEDDSAISVPNWAVFLPGGGSDEAGQNAVYTVSNISRAAMFSVAPAVAPDGTLTYTLAPGEFGTVTFSVSVKDSGGTANNAVDTSATQTFTLTVSPVNGSPSFVAGPPIVVGRDTGPATIVFWAKQISRGPANESDQTLTFTLSDYNTSLFSEQPEVDPNNGSIIFTPARGAFGSTTITATLRDNGGTVHGGVDSYSDTFTITIAAQFGNVAGKNIKATITDDDGTHAVLAIAGNGAGSLITDEQGKVGIVFTGTDARTAVKITTDKAGDGLFTLAGSITAAQSLGSIAAPTVHLRGGLSIAGTSTSLSFADVGTTGTDRMISIGAPATSKDAVALTFRSVKDVSINSATPIKSLTAIDWVDSGGEQDLITAPWIGSLSVPGDRTRPGLGNFGAGLVLSGIGAAKGVTLATFTAAGTVSGVWQIAGSIGTITAGSTGAAWALGTSNSPAGVITSITTTTGDLSGTLVAQSIGTVKVKRDLTGANWTLTKTVSTTVKALGSLTATGKISLSVIRASGNVGTVTAGAMVDSILFAGVASGVSTLPSARADFADMNASIAGVTIKGQSASTSSFVRSLVAAGTLTNVSLKIVDPTGTGAAFGFAADKIKAYARTGRAKLSNLDAASSNHDAALGGDYRVVTV